SSRRLLLGEEMLLERRVNLRVRAALLQDPASIADVPVVPVELQLDELVVRKLPHVDDHGLRIAVGDVVDAAIRAIPNERIRQVARLLVVPVRDEDRAVGAVAKRDASIPLVVREEEVGTTVPHPSGAL